MLKHIIFRGSARGFSLIELMAAAAVVAVLTALALPSYRQWMLRANRSDAYQILVNVQTQQERFFLQNLRYATTLAELRAAPPVGLGVATGWSSRGLYQLDLNGIPPGSYQITARARGAQAADLPACQVLSLDETGTRSPPFGGPCWR